MFCEKCGWIHKLAQEPSCCVACGTPMQPVPAEYLSKSGVLFISEEKRKEFERCITQFPAYDAQLAAQREDRIKVAQQQKEAEIAQKVTEYHQNRVKITCPICHSEQLEKISNIGKVVKVGAFGILGAGDIGKKYRCRSCGYRF